MKESAFPLGVFILIVISAVYSAYVVAQDTTTTTEPTAPPYVIIGEADAEGNIDVAELEARIVTESAFADLLERVGSVNERLARLEEIEAKLDAVLAQNQMQEVTDWRIVAGQIDGVGPVTAKAVLENFRVFEKEAQ